VTITSVRAVGSRVAGVHLALLRVIAKSGHVRRGASLIRPFFPKTDRAEVDFAGGGSLTIGLADAHWSRVPAGLPYEPAVERVLSAALDRPATYLVDCGANIGYWSSRFASSAYVVAIEANPDVFAVLSEHAARNGFAAVNAAIWNAPGLTVDFAWDPDEHEAGAMTVAAETPGTRKAAVTTTTLDAVHDQHGDGRVGVVKLDVEGVESEAIDGGPSVLASGLLVYEDHGRDRTHDTTTSVLERGFEVRWPHDDGAYEPITDVRQLDPLKVKQRSGYNLVAFQPHSQWSDVFKS
jgi:FkbM family methyltransferase